MCGGLLRHDRHSQLERMHRMRGRLLHIGLGVDRIECMQCMRGGLLRHDRHSQLERMHRMRGRLFHIGFRVHRSECMQCMCGGLRRERDDSELSRMYLMCGGHFQGERRQCSLCGVQHGLLLCWCSSYFLQRVRCGLLRHGDRCEHVWVYCVRSGLLHKRYGLRYFDELCCVRGGLWR